MEQAINTFNHTYSAQQQDEIRNIRQRYIPREENKMEQLRRLDASARKAGAIASIAVGTIGTLLLGTGMACILVWSNFFAIGIVAGAIGIAATALAYPIFAVIIKKQREKLAPQIIQLSDELMQ